MADPTPTQVRDFIAAGLPCTVCEAELAATPQQQHEQALARGADEDLTMGR